MKRRSQMTRDEFGLYELLEFFVRSWWAILLFVSLSTAFTYWQFKKNPSFTAHGIVMIESSQSNAMQAVTEKISGLQAFRSDDSERVMEKYLLLLGSRSFAAEAAQEMISTGKAQEFVSLVEGVPESNTEVEQEYLTELLLENVEYERYTVDTIRVNLSLPEAEKAVRALNIAIDAVVAGMGEREARDLSGAKQFLEMQLAEMEERLQDIDNQVMAARSSSLEERLKSLSTANGAQNPIHELEKQLVELRLQLSETESLIGEQKQAIADSFSPTDKYGTRSAVAFLDRKSKLLKVKIASTQKVLASLVAAERARPKDERLLDDLYKRKELEYQLFSDLKKEIMGLDVQRISARNRVRVLEHAAPGSVRSSYSLIAAIIKRGVFAGLVAVLSLFLLEAMNPVVRTRRDLNGLRIAFLGSVPNLDRRRRQNIFRSLIFPANTRRRGIKDFMYIIDYEPDSYHDVIFQNVAARLQNFQLGEDRTPRVLSIMSSGVGEGKSSVARNVAKSIGMSGRRVLLIDADLRKHALTNSHKMQSEQGMSEFLENPKKEFLQPLVKSIGRNMDFLPAGNYSVRSVELLSSRSFKELVEAMKHFYEYVVIDTPPALPYSEVLPIARESDLVALVVHAKKTKIEAVDQVLDKLQFSVNTPIGYILNMYEEGPTLPYYMYPHSRNKRRPAA